MRLLGAERIMTLVERLGLPEDQPIEAKLLSNSIENAQKQLEANNFERRKTVLEYDDVMNQQRKIIYEQRRHVLDGKDLREDIINMINGSIESAAAQFLVGEDQTQWDIEGLKSKYFGLLCWPDDFLFSVEELMGLQPADITEVLR